MSARTDQYFEALVAAAAVDGVPIDEYAETIADAADANVDAEVDEQCDDEPVEPVHTGGMIALLPAEASQLAVEGGEPAAELHLTLAYLGDDLTDTLPEWRAGVVSSAVRAIEGTDPVVGGSLFGRAEFNANNPDRGQCVVWLVDSHGLEPLREKLLAALGDRVPRSDFGTWQPHITVAYHDGYASSNSDPGTAGTIGSDLSASGAARRVSDQRTNTVEGQAVGGAAGSSADPRVSSGRSRASGASNRGSRGRTPYVQGGSVRSAGSPAGDASDRALGAARGRAVADGVPDSRTLHAAGQPGLGDLPTVPEGSDGALPVTETGGDDQFVTDVFAAMRPLAGKSVTFDRLRIAIAGDVTDVPLGQIEADVLIGEVPGDGPVDPMQTAVEVEVPEDEPIEAAGGKRRAATQEGADMYGVSIGDVIGGKVDEAVDSANDTAQAVQRDVTNVAKAVGEAIFGKRKSAPAPKEHDEQKAKAANAPAAKPVENKAPAGKSSTSAESAPAAKVKAGESAPAADKDAESPPDFTVESKVPARKAGDPADRLEEDQVPDTGGEGGKLVEFENGVAKYDDGTETNGVTWMRSPVLPGMGYDGKEMLEDQAPLKGAEGGQLVSFGDGVAVYDDGTETDGKQWRRSKAAS